MVRNIFTLTFTTISFVGKNVAFGTIYYFFSSQYCWCSRRLSRILSGGYFCASVPSMFIDTLFRFIAYCRLLIAFIYIWKLLTSYYFWSYFAYQIFIMMVIILISSCPIKLLTYFAVGNGTWRHPIMYLMIECFAVMLEEMIARSTFDLWHIVIQGLNQKLPIWQWQRQSNSTMKI